MTELACDPLAVESIAMTVVALSFSVLVLAFARVVWRLKPKDPSK